MSIIEVILLVLVIVALLVAYQARHDHTTFKAQALADATATKAAADKAIEAVKTDLNDVKARLLVAEHKVENPVPAPVVASVTASNAPGVAGA